MNKIIAVSAIVDTCSMTIYTNTGETVVILQGDHRLPVFVKALQKGLKKPGDTVELELEPEVVKGVIPTDSKLAGFSQFEQQSGLVKFFKVAKNAIESFFGNGEKPEKDYAGTARDQSAEHVPSMELGRSYDLYDAIDQVKVSVSGQPEDAPAEQLSSIEEVMAHAQTVPASSPDFRMTEQEEKTHDIVAVVEQEDGSLGMVPNAHKLATQVAHATETGNTKGIEALLKRMAKIAGTRQHSVEDLMKFIQRGDLPVTEDGRIVFYKLLNASPSKQFGFVDVHSGNVTQGANVRVQMAESMVDSNRRRDCSHGLHVARRQYLRHFHGDSCFIGSLAPEDVIAVPDYDANKMRVCRYDLHFLLSHNEFNLVKDNKPFHADSAAAKMLSLILAGKQPEVTHIVTIGGRHGTQLAIDETGVQAPTTEEVNAAVAEAVPVAPIEEVSPHNVGKQKGPNVLDADKVDPTSLAQAEPESLMTEDTHPEPVSTQRDTFKAKGEPVKKEAPAPKEGTPRAQIAALLASGPMSAEVAKRAYLIKRAAKKGWDKLGVDAATEQKIKDLLSK